MVMLYVQIPSVFALLCSSASLQLLHVAQDMLNIFHPSFFFSSSFSHQPISSCNFFSFFFLLLQLVFYPLNKVPAFFLYVVMAVVSCACFRGCLLPINRTNKLLTRTLWVLATAFAHRASNILYTESIFELSVDVIDIKQKFMAPSV